MLSQWESASAQGTKKSHEVNGTKISSEETYEYNTGDDMLFEYKAPSWVS